MRPQALHADQHHQGRSGHRKRHQRAIWDVLRNTDRVVKEALLGDMNTEQLGYLIEHNDQSYPRLETGQHRAGNEVGDEAEAQ